MRMCSKLEEQIRELTQADIQIRSRSPQPKQTLLTSVSARDLAMDSLEERDRGMMAMSLDPMMMQNQVNR